MLVILTLCCTLTVCYMLDAGAAYIMLVMEYMEKGPVLVTNNSHHFDRWGWDSYICSTALETLRCSQGRLPPRCKSQDVLLAGSGVVVLCCRRPLSLLWPLRTSNMLLDVRTCVHLCSPALQLS
jgi:hypothetical protein